MQEIDEKSLKRLNQPLVKDLIRLLIKYDITAHELNKWSRWLMLAESENGFGREAIIKTLNFKKGS